MSDDTKNLVTQIKNRSFIAISGAETMTFLQGLITNDITLLEKHDVVYSCLLTANGKFLHDFFIFKHPDQQNTLLLACEETRRDDLMKRLKIYKLRSKVELVIEDNIKLYYLRNTDLSDHSKGCIADPRAENLGYFYLSPNKNFITDFNFNETNHDAYENFRTQNCLPDGSAEMEPQRADIQQFNLDLLNAISFTKGCFIGQEPIARIHHRGLLKRRAFAFSMSEPNSSITSGGTITCGDKTIGKVHSTSGQFGIAVLKINDLKENLDNHQIHCNNVIIQLIIPKWIEEVINLSVV